MISTQEVKIKIPENITSDYIETELGNMGYEVLRWAITGKTFGHFILNVVVVND